MKPSLTPPVFHLPVILYISPQLHETPTRAFSECDIGRHARMYNPRSWDDQRTPSAINFDDESSVRTIVSEFANLLELSRMRMLHFALKLRYQAMRSLRRIITCVSSLAGIVDYFEASYCSETALLVKCRTAGPSPVLCWKPARHLRQYRSCIVRWAPRRFTT